MKLFPKVLLKWNEPRDVTRAALADLSISQRLWLRNFGPLISGLLTGLFIVLPLVGIPNSTVEWQLFVGAPLALAAFFVLVYCLVGLFPTQVIITELSVRHARPTGENRWPYETLDSYIVTEVDLHGVSARLLLLQTKAGEDIALAVADSVTNEQIHDALQGRVDVASEDGAEPLTAADASRS